MIDLHHIDDLARRLSELVPPGLRESGEELQASFLMTLIAAPTDLVRTLAAGPMNFLYLLQARERALGGGQ